MNEAQVKGGYWLGYWNALRREHGTEVAVQTPAGATPTIAQSVALLAAANISGVARKQGPPMPVSRGSPWRAFNICMRLCGLLALSSGILLLGWSMLLTFHAGLIGRFHGPLTSPVFGPQFFWLGAWCVLLGVAILRARTYRPDLGDASFLVDSFGVKLQRVFPPKRFWWTGDPRPDSTATRLMRRSD
jgi:hypothetical protein